MSYIVPRDIPKGCEQCPFNGHTKCRIMPIGFDEYPLVGRRPEWCPLVEVKEPHGDLADKDKLMKEFMDSDLDHLQRDDWKEVIQIVSDADVVIEAEGGEE